MTFDKYKKGREKFSDCIFPDDGHEHGYVWSRKIGWRIVKGRKLSELPEQEWDIKIPKEV